MSLSDFITWTPLPWLVVGGLLAWALCRAAAVGDRQLEQARRALARPTTLVRAGAAHVSLESSAATPEMICRWALEDGHRRPGVDEARARRDVRPAGSLSNVVPIDEARRRRERGDAA